MLVATTEARRFNTGFELSKGFVSHGLTLALLAGASLPAALAFFCSAARAELAAASAASSASVCGAAGTAAGATFPSSVQARVKALTPLWEGH